jgi:hypothetical protein
MAELLASAAAGGVVYAAVALALLRGRLPRALLRSPPGAVAAE